MAQNLRTTRSGRSTLAVLAGGALAAAVDSAENYGFVHFLPAGWQYVGLSYVLVGLVTAAPTMCIRPAGPAIGLLTGAVAVFAFVAGDFAYVFASSLWHGTSFELGDYLLSYGEFQSPYTVALESLAPLAALVLCRLRLHRLRLHRLDRLGVAARPRGRHAGPFVGADPVGVDPTDLKVAADSADLKPVGPEHHVPAPARAVDEPHHADVD